MEAVVAALQVAVGITEVVYNRVAVATAVVVVAGIVDTVDLVDFASFVPLPT